MNIIKTVCTATVVLMTGMLTSCSDYLDVSKELAQNLDKEEVFSKAKYIKQWYGEIYQTCPNYSEAGLDVKIQMEPLMRKLSIQEKSFVLILVC